MQAITIGHYGAPEVCVATTLPAPRPGPHDLLVQVRAVGLTQGDRRLRSGDFPGLTFIPGRLAMGITGPRAAIPGTVFAGRVVATGAAVTRYAPGEEIFGFVMSGALAEQLCVSEQGSIAPLPAGWSCAEAASLAYGAGTARHFLQVAAGLRQGERVAIVGAVGGVGRYAVQLARHLGAHVTAVVRPHQEAAARALGADAVCSLDALSGHHDVVFDTTGAVTPRMARRWLGPEGRYATVYASLAVILAILLRPLLGGPRVITGVALTSATSMAALRELAEAGAFRPKVGRRFALTEAAAAHACLERERPDAEIILEPVGA